MAGCCAISTEYSNHILEKIPENVFSYFFRVMFFFVRGVMKQSDKNLEIKHIQQSQYRQIGQQFFSKSGKKRKKTEFFAEISLSL